METFLSFDHKKKFKMETFKYKIGEMVDDVSLSWETILKEIDVMKTDTHRIYVNEVTDSVYIFTYVTHDVFHKIIYDEIFQRFVLLYIIFGMLSVYDNLFVAYDLIILLYICFIFQCFLFFFYIVPVFLKLIQFNHSYVISLLVFLLMFLTLFHACIFFYMHLYSHIL
jgi:hypothetical protein